MELDVKNVPAFTAWGYEQYQATRSEESPLGIPLSNSKDPMMRCDPLGYPRLFAYNYGFEFLQLPDRVIQFFEWGHNWRTIWTDGRKLPENPPEPRWLGYAVGHWEGDTFIVESNGYDDRSWLTEDRRDRRWGFPHGDQLRVEEKYRRISYDTLEATLTIIDPKVFKKPWTTTGKIRMSVEPSSESICVFFPTTTSLTNSTSSQRQSENNREIHRESSQTMVSKKLITPPQRRPALHKKSWAVIDRPYSLGFATVGALYERPRYISCAKPRRPQSKSS